MVSIKIKDSLPGWLIQSLEIRDENGTLFHCYFHKHRFTGYIRLDHDWYLLLCISSAFGKFPESQTLTNLFVYGIGGVSCLSCIIYPVIYLGTGWLYAFLHRREAVLSLEIGALGGGLSSALAGLIAGIFSGLVSIILTPLIYQSSFPGQMPPGTNFPFQSINTLMTSFGSLFSACWSALIAGGLGVLAVDRRALYSNRSRS
jgi:hypothetical protein